MYNGNSITSQIQLAQVLHSSSTQLRNAILKNCNPFLIEFLSDLAFNFLRANIECSKSQFVCLKKYKNILKKLSINEVGSKSLYEASIRKKRIILHRIKDSNFWHNFLLPILKRN